MSYAKMSCNVRSPRTRGLRRYVAVDSAKTCQRASGPHHDAVVMRHMPHAAARRYGRAESARLRRQMLQDTMAASRARYDDGSDATQWRYCCDAYYMAWRGVSAMC